MYCIHVTENKNLNSIKKKGLIPHKPYLSEHADLFRSWFKKDGVVYLMKYESKKRFEKFIKDFIYIQLWGKPRNIWAGNHPSKEWENIPEIFFEINFKSFSILSIQIDSRKLHCREGTHSQDASMKTFVGMDSNYEHDDKPLVVTPDRISSSRISEIGNAYPVIRNNKIENIKLEGWA